MTRIGLPRSLNIYQYYPLWRTFFEELDAQVILSSPTDRSILAEGARLVADVTCLPVKVFAGHVIWLRDHGEVDSVFVPATRSVERGAMHCSKFMALPDVIKAVVPDCPTLLETDIDAHRYKIGLNDAYFRLGRKLVRSSRKVKNAWKQALQRDEAFQRLLIDDALTYPEALAELYPDDWTLVKKPINSSDLRVALVGHPYCLYDNYINHDLVVHLRKLGVQIRTSEMVSVPDAMDGIQQTTGQTRWFYENWVSGAGGHYLQHPDVDGLIAVMAFTCGPDSAMFETLSRRAHALGRPFMSLVLDEHGSATGMLTRLEAFVDMLNRQRKMQPALSIGESVQEKKSAPAILHQNSKTILGFPRMGTSAIPLKSLFKGIGLQVELGPTLSNRTVSLGARYSPEFICTPYKYILGNMLEMIEAGANTLLYMDGAELCRNSCYTQMLRDVLFDMGQKVRLVSTGVFEKGGLFALPKFLSQFMDDFSWSVVLGQIRLAIAKMNLLDEIERRVQFLRPRQAVEGSADKVWVEAQRRIEEDANPAAVKSTRADILQKMDQIEVDPTRKPVRITTTGEYYAVLEPFYNQDVERILGKLGAEVHRTIMLGDWLKSAMILDALGLHRSEVEQAAKPYLRWNIGGEGLLTVGQTVHKAKMGFDGVVELLPFTCLPEVTALNILPKISRELNIPVIYFILDEQSGQAGIRTRLEAFVDLLFRRRELQPAAA